MRAVLQRVRSARVRVEGTVVGAIGRGLLVLVGFEHEDTEREVARLARRIAELRVFDDGSGRMNLSVEAVQGEVLVVSQFTLAATTRKGTRPSFHRAAPPERAEALYRELIASLVQRGLRVAEGRFQALMDVELVNDGPVTLILESRRGAGVE